MLIKLVKHYHCTFFHAWSGCNTISVPFCQGKAILLKKIKESQENQQISCLMSVPKATKEEIGSAGI